LQYMQIQYNNKIRKLGRGSWLLLSKYAFI
jgi:hypothetical protein